MADKNVQIRDLAGNNLFPKTKGSLVYNNSDQNLGAVEAGAQVNIIEGVQVNGTDLTPDANKKVNVVIPAADQYTITKASTAEAGYAATYQLFKNSTAVGDKINIPKDMVLDTVELKTCTTDDVPVEGYVVGDKYIEFTFLNKTSSKLYLLVSDLVDVYTEGNGINISNANVISVDTTDTNIVDTAPTQNSTKFVQSGGVYTALAGKQPTIDATHKLLSDLVDTTGQTNLFVTSTEKSTWSGKQDALSVDQLAACNSGITSTKVSSYDAHVADTDIHVTTAEKSTWSGKQDAISDLATIRSGAAAGATALQQSDVSDTYVANGTDPINSKAIANLITFVELA